MQRLNVVAMVLLLAFASSAVADVTGLNQGNADLKSAGPLAFGPEGVLLVGDTEAAAVFAIATGDTRGDAAKADYNLKNLDKKIAEATGAAKGTVSINDLAVNPLSGNLYLSGAKDGSPALFVVEVNGQIRELSLKNAKFAKAVLPNPPENKVTGEGRRRRNYRSESITDLAYLDGQILVSGRSASNAPSTVRLLSFPPQEADPGASLEIFHGAHGKVENYSVPRTFVPFIIDGEQHVLTAHTCTPLVKVPLSSIAPGKSVKGTTVAELGNRNRPLDMISYKKDGKSFLLLSNSSRGVMKISTENIAEREPIQQRVERGGVAGQPYETIEDLTGVVQLDRLNEGNAVVLIESDSGFDLKTIQLP